MEEQIEKVQQNDSYAPLKLENQLCFPLYAASKEITRAYKPYLDKIDLTYTQYITMMVLWDKKQINVKTLGEFLYLDSGTLTPVLKKLEQKGLITRARDKEDERVLIVSITEEGEALREQALEVPQCMSCLLHISPEDAGQLYQLLYKILGNLQQNR